MNDAEAANDLAQWFLNIFEGFLNIFKALEPAAAGL